MKKSMLFAALAAALIVVLAAACAPSTDESKTPHDVFAGAEFTDNEVIVVLVEGYSYSHLSPSDFPDINVAGIEVLMAAHDSGCDICLITLTTHDKTNVVNSVRKMQNYSFIKYAEPNYIYEAECETGEPAAARRSA